MPAEPALHEAAEPEMVLMSKALLPRGRQDLLDLLPQKPVVDRLISRYFTSNSPSQRKPSMLSCPISSSRPSVPRKGC